MVGSRILAERTMLHMLRGHCNSPIAGHCHTTADGSEFVRAQAWGPIGDPATLGSRVAADLLDRGARHYGGPRLEAAPTHLADVVDADVLHIRP